MFLAEKATTCAEKKEQKSIHLWLPAVGVIEALSLKVKGPASS